MECTEKITLTNMCMIYDDAGNVLVEDKLVGNSHGLIFPGGHVESNESLVDSTIREIGEETGLKITNLHLCGIKDWIEDKDIRYMVFLYKTNQYEGKLCSSNEGNVFWMPIDELKQRPMLWHLEKMLHIFCESDYSELYFIKENNEPILK